MDFYLVKIARKGKLNEKTYNKNMRGVHNKNLIRSFYVAIRKERRTNMNGGKIIILPCGLVKFISDVDIYINMEKKQIEIYCYPEENIRAGGKIPEKCEECSKKFIVTFDIIIERTEKEDSAG